MEATRTIELTLEQLDVVREALNKYASAKEEAIRKFRADEFRSNDKDYKKWNKEDTEEYFIARDIDHQLRQAVVELRYNND
jgi:hypothetical protein|tara:strand:- start:344 stop:586 length:243 start_codon:yes stop_codon:yes gene_type:complete